MKEQYQFTISGNVRAKEFAQHLTIGISTYWQQIKEYLNPDNLSKIDKILRIILTVVKLINVGD